MTKNPKFSKFQSFYAIFVKFSTDFVDWNVGKSQQGTNCCPVVFFEEIWGGKYPAGPRASCFTKFAKKYCLRNMKKYIHRIQLTSI